MTRQTRSGRLGILAIQVATILLVLGTVSGTAGDPAAQTGLVASDLMLASVALDTDEAAIDLPTDSPTAFGLLAMADEVGGIASALDPLGLSGVPHLATSPLDDLVPAAVSDAVWSPGDSVAAASVAGASSRGTPSVRRVEPSTRLSSRGRPIEVGGSYRFNYGGKFEGEASGSDAAIEGNGRLHWDSSARVLHIRGCREGDRRITLCYHFKSPYMMKDALSELEGEIAGSEGDRVELAFSRDGRSFSHAVRAFGREDGNPFLLTTNASQKHNGGELWVRITATLAPDSHVALSDFRTACRVKADERIPTTVVARR